MNKDLEKLKTKLENFKTNNSIETEKAANERMQETYNRCKMVFAQ